jgi:hypothetical protein
MWAAQDCAMANIVASMLEKTICIYGYNHIIKVLIMGLFTLLQD